MAKIKTKSTKLKSYPKSKKVILGLTLVVVAGFLLQRYFNFKKIASLETETIKRGDVTESLILSGSIQAQNYARLSFQGSGKLSWVGVSEGDLVKKGQALARLDLNNLNQQLEQASADLRYYEAYAARVLDDVKGNDDDETFEQREARTQAQAGRDKAYRAYEIVKQNIANSILRSPFDGVVTRVNFPFTGVNVTFSDTQVEVVDIKTAYFSVGADQTEVVDISVGEKVEILLDAFPEKSFSGEVTFVSSAPRAGEVGSVYEIKVKLIDIGDDVEKLKVGMSGDVKFMIGKKENVLYVSPKFIKSDPNGKYLKLNDPNSKEYVQVGIEGDDGVEVYSNTLNEGMKVFD